MIHFLIRITGFFNGWTAQWQQSNLWQSSIALWWKHVTIQVFDRQMISSNVLLHVEEQHYVRNARFIDRTTVILYLAAITGKDSLTKCPSGRTIRVWLCSFKLCIRHMIIHSKWDYKSGCAASKTTIAFKIIDLLMGTGIHVMTDLVKRNIMN
jgi:hypothetical protein